ncbi:MAG: DivIVA domain-containing protein [Streptosporangiales bacterium]|nr:DivIVA domain-containing protein [Streptosporangiales bacterium]MBO0891494.1 DivIVA domain-containing protein [Acidothermales bacterium]
MDESLPDQGFDIVIRGYARGQVDEYLTGVEATMERLRNRVAELNRRLGVLQRRLDDSDQPAPGEAGARVARMLRLAEDEAVKLVQQATEDAERIREAVERETGQRRKNATMESERIIEHAKDTAEQLVQVAAADAERLRAEADEHIERALAELTRQRDELRQERKAVDTRLARIRAAHGGTGAGAAGRDGEAR